MSTYRSTRVSIRCNRCNPRAPVPAEQASKRSRDIAICIAPSFHFHLIARLHQACAITAHAESHVLLLASVTARVQNQYLSRAGGSNDGFAWGTAIRSTFPADTWRGQPAGGQLNASREGFSGRAAGGRDKAMANSQSSVRTRPSPPKPWPR